MAAAAAAVAAALLLLLIIPLPPQRLWGGRTTGLWQAMLKNTALLWYTGTTAIASTEDKVHNNLTSVHRRKLWFFAIRDLPP